MNTDKKRTGDMFGGHAKLYAQARPTYQQEMYAYITDLCENTDAVWDCATGTGQAALPLSEIFTKVCATDINEKQISEAESRNNIAYSVASAENTEFADESFDLVTVAQALHWFDYDKFWPEVDRVLKPNGVFVAWGYDWTKIDFDVDFQIEENLFNLLTNYWNPKAKILWGGYKPEKVSFPYELIETPSFTIDLHWSIDQLFQYFLSWSSTQAYIKDNGTRLIDHAKEQVRKVWGHPNETKLIQWPIHMLVGIKK
jgi:SAM-dependent methyltransferase